MIHNASVAVIGLGGVGSWVVEALARSGIHRLILFDIDDTCISNVNRQLPEHPLSVDILAKPSDALKERVLDSNI